MTDELTESASVRVPKNLYFGSSHKLTSMKGDSLFLTPYQGIASIFTIDRKQIVKDLCKKKTGHEPTSFGLKYDEWGNSDSSLKKPLKKVHMYHNIQSMKDDVYSGISKGYIYTIDSDMVKDNLELFVTKDSNREVVYHGKEPLKPSKITPVTVEWELRYREFE